MRVHDSICVDCRRKKYRNSCTIYSSPAVAAQKFVYAHKIVCAVLFFFRYLSFVYQIFDVRMDVYCVTTDTRTNRKVWENLFPFCPHSTNLSLIYWLVIFAWCQTTCMNRYRSLLVNRVLHYFFFIFFAEPITNYRTEILIASVKTEYRFSLLCCFVFRLVFIFLFRLFVSAVNFIVQSSCWTYFVFCLSILLYICLVQLCRVTSPVSQSVDIDRFR